MQTFYEHTELFSTVLVALLPKKRSTGNYNLPADHLVHSTDLRASAQTCSTVARVMAEKKAVQGLVGTLTSKICDVRGT